MSVVQLLQVTRGKEESQDSAQVDQWTASHKDFVWINQSINQSMHFFALKTYAERYTLFAGTLVSGDINFMGLFTGVSWRGNV